MKSGGYLFTPLTDVLDHNLAGYYPCLMLCSMVESGGRIWPSSTGIIDTTLVTSIHVPGRFARRNQVNISRLRPSMYSTATLLAHIQIPCRVRLVGACEHMPFLFPDAADRRDHRGSDGL